MKRTVRFHRPRPAPAAALFLLATAVPAAGQHRLAVGVAMTDPRIEAGSDIGTFDGPAATYLYSWGGRRSWALGFSASGGTHGSADRPLRSPFPELRASTHNRTGIYLAVLQYRYPARTVQPYGQVGAGYGEFITQTEIVCDDCSEGERLLVDDLSDGAFVAGGGAGILLPLYRRERASRVGLDGKRNQPDPFRLDLDVGVRWLRGGEVGFLTEDPVFDDEGRLLAESFERHPIEVFQYLVGASIAW